MNVVALQMDIAWEDRAENHRRVQRLLESDPPSQDSLIVLPEMFASGFSMNTARTADDAGESLQFLRSIAKRYSSHVLAGVVTTHRDDLACYNESVLVDPQGREAFRYQKLHPFTLGGESANYGKGANVVTAALRGFRIAPFVCYDLRFPEIFRIATVQGATLLVVIANWPSPRIHHWVTLLQARAIESQAYVVGVNRVGNDPKLEHPGRSMIVDPGGQIIADAGTEQCLIRAKLDPAVVQETRTRLPFLKDIRREFLSPHAAD